jgi:hypothetical protein
LFIGWVAAADHDGKPWLVATTIDCPADPTIADISTIETVVALFCYRGRDLTFSGTVFPSGLCDYAGSPRWSPEWMSPWCGGAAIAESADALSGEGPLLGFAVPPGVATAAGFSQLPELLETPLEGSVVAHFDDAVADSCAAENWGEFEGSPPHAFDVATVGFVCRTRLVASEIELQMP